LLGVDQNFPFIFHFTIYTLKLKTTSMASGEARGNYHYKFLAVRKLSEKSYCCRNFLVENMKVEVENSILGKFKGKVEMLSTHNFLRLKIAIVRRNSVRNVQFLSENCNFLSHQHFLTAASHCLFPGPSRGWVGGVSYPGPRDVWGALPLARNN